MKRRTSVSSADVVRGVVRAAEHVAGQLDPALARSRASAESILRDAQQLHPETTAGSEGRWQDEIIAREIPEGASVLDLGCGSGQLLERLIRTRRAQGQGIELDAEQVLACVGRGVPVFQADLDEGLSGFPDGRFDVVVLEETLQTLHKPHAVLSEMLRVGRQCIVSFPNFGHWRVRMLLSLQGRMPVTGRLPHRWYDTPNIHFCTLDDLLDWAAASGVRVVQGFCMEDGVVRPLKPGDNLHAEEVLLFMAPA